jgi:hypothetical protein
LETSDKPHGANGKGKASTLILTLNHDTFALNIGGQVLCEDLAMAMLQQAQRHFEAVLRARQALQLQQQIAEEMHLRAVGAQLQKRGG